MSRPALAQRLERLGLGSQPLDREPDRGEQPPEPAEIRVGLRVELLGNRKIPLPRARGERLPEECLSALPADEQAVRIRRRRRAEQFPSCSLGAIHMLGTVAGE